MIKTMRLSTVIVAVVSITGTGAADVGAQAARATAGPVISPSRNVPSM